VVAFTRPYARFAPATTPRSTRGGVTTTPRSTREAGAGA
jgi:hypothetical protein